MRDYSKVAPTFWTGQTGRQIKESGPESVIVALYLMTSPHANMLGLYYCPLAYIANDTGLSMQGASKGLQRSIEAHLCAYDAPSEVVWVYEMAGYQIEWQLKPGDKRVSGIAREYAKLPKCPFLSEFFDKYAAAFHMDNRRGSEGAPMPHRSQEQEQEQEQYKQPLSDSDRTTVAGTSKKTTEDSRAAEDRFNAFWSSYPRKTAKQRALAVWKRKKCWNGEFDAIIAGLTAHKESDQWQRDEGRYIPHPATFLEQERWRDEIDCPVHGQKIGGLTF